MHVAEGMRSEVAQFPEGAVRIYVERLNGDGSPIFSVFAKIALTDEKNDLAILEVDPNSIEQTVVDQISILQIADAESEVGDEVAMSGYRGDETRPFTSMGTVALVSDRSEATKSLPEKTVFCNLTSLPGNSGAAIVSIRTGKVIGVQLGALNWDQTPSGMSYGANAFSVSTLITNYQALNSGAN